MKIIVDVPDSKAATMLELLESFHFVQAIPLPVNESFEKALSLVEVAQTVAVLNQMLIQQIQAYNTDQMQKELIALKAVYLRGMN